jgi:hypothetical protein
LGKSQWGDVLPGKQSGFTVEAVHRSSGDTSDDCRVMQVLGDHADCLTDHG